MLFHLSFNFTYETNLYVDYELKSNTEGDVSKEEVVQKIYQAIDFFKEKKNYSYDEKAKAIGSLVGKYLGHKNLKWVKSFVVDIYSQETVGAYQAKYEKDIEVGKIPQPKNIFLNPHELEENKIVKSNNMGCIKYNFDSIIDKSDNKDAYEVIPSTETIDNIREQLQLALNNNYTKYSDLTYEHGAMDMLNWLLTLAPEGEDFLIDNYTYIDNI